MNSHINEYCNNYNPNIERIAETNRRLRNAKLSQRMN